MYIQHEIMKVNSFLSPITWSAKTQHHQYASTNFLFYYCKAIRFGCKLCCFQISWNETVLLNVYIYKEDMPAFHSFQLRFCWSQALQVPTKDKRTPKAIGTNFSILLIFHLRSFMPGVYNLPYHLHHINLWYVLQKCWDIIKEDLWAVRLIP